MLLSGTLVDLILTIMHMVGKFVGKYCFVYFDNL